MEDGTKEPEGVNPFEHLWLDHDVMEYLKISKSSIRRLRIKNAVPYLQIGGTYYYPKEMFIEAMWARLNAPFRHRRPFLK